MTAFYIIKQRQPYLGSAEDKRTVLRKKRWGPESSHITAQSTVKALPFCLKCTVTKKTTNFVWKCLSHNRMDHSFGLSIWLKCKSKKNQLISCKFEALFPHNSMDHSFGPSNWLKRTDIKKQLISYKLEAFLFNLYITLWIKELKH